MFERFVGEAASEFVFALDEVGKGDVEDFGVGGGEVGVSGVRGVVEHLDAIGCGVDSVFLEIE